MTDDGGPSQESTVKKVCAAYNQNIQAGTIQRFMLETGRGKEIGPLIPTLMENGKKLKDGGQAREKKIINVDAIEK